MERSPGLDDLVAAVRVVLAHERGATETTYRPRDGASFVAAARQHGVVPVLMGQVAALELDRDTARSLTALALMQQRLLAVATADLHAVLDAFDDADIRAVVIKGIPLAVRTGGAAAARSVGDIDLLIEHGDLQRAHDVMVSNGWARKTSRVSALDGAYRRWVRFVDYHEVFVARERSLVEVHWRLNQTLSTRAAFDGLIARSSTVEVDGRSVPVLGAADDMALVATHAARHVFSHLKWVVDVARFWSLLDDVDRARSLELAESWDSGRAHRLAIAVVDRLGMLDGAPIARAAAVSLIDADTEKLVERAITHPEGHRSAKQHRLRVRTALQETWTDRARLVGEILLPTDVLADPRVPAKLSLLAAPLRPLWRWRSQP